MILDERIKVDARVLVTMDWNNQTGFAGHTAIIASIGKSGQFPFRLMFDNPIIQKKNGWFWSHTQFIYLEDQSYVR